MSRRERAQAVILKSVDVGDADRFCILLTREQGRIAARAKGVRKLGSRMGGSLLPFHRVSLEITESSAGHLVTGTELLNGFDASSIQSFAAAHEAAELVMALLQDGDPFPEAFDAFVSFLDVAEIQPDTAFLLLSFQLLSILGFLPDPETMPSFGAYGPEEKVFIQAALDGRLITNITPGCVLRLRTLADTLISDITVSPLKAREASVSLRK